MDGGTQIATPPGPYGIAIGDLNVDGRPDLAVASYGSGAGNTVSVMLASGSAGNFGAKTDFTTATGPVSVAMADVNGDGKQDLVTGNYTSDNVSVLLGNGAGGFGAKTDFTAGDAPYYLAIGDLNGDDRPDVVVPNHLASNLSVLLNTTASGASSPTFAGHVDYPTRPACGHQAGAACRSCSPRVPRGASGRGSIS